MSEISYYTSEPRFNRTGLIAWGIVMIVLGVVLGLGTLAGALRMLAVAGKAGQKGIPQAIGSLITVLIIYIGMAVALIWTGVGSCYGQRWVRPIVLIATLPASIVGFVIVSAMAIGMAISQYTVATGSTRPTYSSRLNFGLVIGMVFTFCLIVALPAAMFWFYHRPQMRETLQSLDLAPSRWTDGRPVPLLGWAVGFFVFGFLALAGLSVTHIAFFATILNGAAATAVILLVGGAMMFGGWLCYRQQIAGWWLTVIVITYQFISSTTFHFFGDQNTLMTAITGNQHIAETSRGMLTNSITGAGIFYLLVLGYALYVRRFFSLDQTPEL